MKTLASIIKTVEEAKTDREKVKILKENSSAALKMIVGVAVDPGVHWLVPPGPPPYTPLAKSTDQEGRLWKDYNHLNYFVNSQEGKNIKQMRREEMFVQFLESIDPDDAAMLIRAKDGSLNISVNVVKKAFPNMTKDWD